MLYLLFCITGLIALAIVCATVITLAEGNKTKYEDINEDEVYSSGWTD